MSANRDISSLYDILQAASLIREFVANKDIEELEADKMCYSAVIRQLEIIGEAANRISKEFQAAHTDIPWRKVIGMRNVLIHSYDDVIVDEVWRAATFSVPELARLVTNILP